MLLVVSFQLTFNTISCGHFRNSLAQVEFVICRDSHLICSEGRFRRLALEEEEEWEVPWCLLQCM
jgi:hypothetical protein